MQSAHELQKLGASSLVPTLVMVSLLRELGPVIIAVIVIGEAASAVTAELGTMKVSEEIEALNVMAINPIRFLIVPRVLAMLVMLPTLTVMGNYITRGRGRLGHLPLRAGHEHGELHFKRAQELPPVGICIPG